MTPRIPFSVYCRSKVTFISALFAAAALFFIWHTNAQTLQSEETAKATTDDRPVTIRAEKIGLPYLSLADGHEINVQADAPGGQATLLASADFDSDGVPDLVTADETGSLRLYRGNPEAKRSLILKAEGVAEPPAFFPYGQTFSLGIIPDYLETGDFNADGKQDIIAVAKGDHRLQFLSGDGTGNFEPVQSLAVDGRITAFAAGNVGSSDGQTDVVAAVSTKNGSFLMVFEFPEGAFKHAPEIIRLPSNATDIALGDLNGDHYSDIAVACGSSLTIVGGRGQAYPWDLNKESGVVRPSANVETRQLSAPTVGIAIGKFNGERMSSLAIMTTGGTIFTLKPSEFRNYRRPIPQSPTGRTVSPKFSPSGVVPSARIMMPESLGQGELNPADGTMRVEGHLSPDEMRKATTKQYDDSVKAMRAKTKDEQSSIITQARLSKDPQHTKQAYIDSIAGEPLGLSQWKASLIISSGNLASAAAGNGGGKLLRTARVSFSNNDDLIVLNSAAKRIDLVVQPSTDMKSSAAQLISLDTESAPLAVLPMRLNGDALDDLVVLRAGSAVPSVVSSTPTSIIIVNSTSDDGSGVCDGVGPCTLRRAMEIAAFSPGTIVAVLIPGPGVHTIMPVAELPTIHAPGVYLAAGVGAAGEHLQEISGDLAGYSDGIKIRASSCTVQDFVINGFHGYQDPDTGSITGGNAITSESTTISVNNGNNTFTGNYLGSDPTGTIKKGNDDGLLVFDSDGNTIVNNVLSGNSINGFGFGLDVTAGDNNIIHGNKIGTSAAGNVRLANDTGVFLTGSNNQFGGDGNGDGNTVSGNGHDREPGNPNYPGCDSGGMDILPLYDVLTGRQLTELNYVKGNRMGTSSDGTQRLGNCYMALITLAQNMTVIGSITPTGRNIISDNGLDGLWCGFPGVPYNEGGFCAIVGNNIGTDITGTVSMGNSSRNLQGGLQFITAAVFIDNSDTFSNVGAPGGMDPGGPCTGFCNLISGQSDSTPGGPPQGTLARYGWGTVGVFNNYMGTDNSGTQPIPNSVGVFMGSALIYPGTSYVGWYGTNPDVSLGNLFSGNDYGSVGCGGFSYTSGGCFILGNLIGTDASGSFALPNGHADSPFQNTVVRLSTGAGTSYVGDSNPLGRNVIAANEDSGVETRNYVGDNRIVNNYIGVNKFGTPLGNGGNGIQVEFGSAEIGDSSPADVNNISNNGGTGIFLSSPYLPAFLTTGVNIGNNSISNNGGLGVDIQPTSYSNSGDGVTPNDCGDEDIGTNDVQNYPVLAAPAFNSDGTVSIGGTLRSEPFQPYRVDFYSNSSADPTGYGEGQSFIGSVIVTTDGNGFVNIGFISSVTVPAGSLITSTATNENGSTSEFSCVAGQCVGGRPDSPDTGCPLPMVVNVTSDEHDADLTDGVCDTDTSNPGYQCSLRAALEQANDTHALSRSISFNIPGGGVQTITPASALPNITKPVQIYGSTQGGTPNSHLIEINGSNAGGNADGLTLDTGSDGSVIDELTINRFFTKFGINIKASSNNKVKGCYLGLNSDGLSYPPAADEAHTQLGGIGVGTPGNTIGGVLSIDSNVISGNSGGIAIAGGGSNKVLNNKIGTDKNGNAFMDSGNVASGNFVGILISASDGNTIGGDIGSAGNQISNNSTDGVVILQSKNTIVKGNFIGTDASGLHGIQNGRFGIGIVGGASSGNTIGGTKPSDRNIISGNNFNATSAGVLIDATASTGNQVLGNYIGVDVNAQNPLPNSIGVSVLASGNTIGSTAAPNVISGNAKGGILVTTSADGTNAGTSIIGNFIGVNQNGVGLANTPFGIFLVGGVQSTNIRDNTISGNSAGAGVAIAFGSGFSTAPTNNTVFRNKIGTDPTGNTAVPNTFGVLIAQASTNNITGNIISGNTPGGGVLLLDDVPPPSPGARTAKADETFPKGAQAESLVASLLALPAAHASTVVESPDKNSAAMQRPSSVSQTSGNQITGNYIGLNAGGTTALANSPAGVIITKGASGNTVGGNSASTRNIISGNTDTGVFIGNTTVSGALPTGNIVTGNYIGTNATGSSGVPNTKYGVWLLGAQGNFIGGDTADLGNLIGFNLQDGISVEGNDTTGNEVKGNTLFLNGANGIKIQSLGTSLKILNNKIGTDDNGSAGLGNGANGIKIDGQGTPPRPQNTGDVPTGTIPIPIPIEIDDNTVVSNGGNGVEIDNIGTPVGCSANRPLSPPFPGVKMSGNYVSISIPPAAPEVKLPNIGAGILLNNASGVVIGTVNDPRRNIISGSVEAGVKIQGNSTQNTIKAGVIGTDLGGASSYGNGGGGVIVTDGASSTEIGGPEPEADNIIADNTGPGVWIQDNAGNCNLVDPNSIYGNSGLGIDIGPEGINPNDPGDADPGPNNLQNYPDVLNLFIDGNGDLIIDYRVDSMPGNSNYGTDGIYVEFFKSDAFGQGQLFLGSDHFTEGDYNNSGSKEINLGNAALLGYTNGDLITSTATDADGNTSEFFPVNGIPPTPTATPTDTPTVTPTATPTAPPAITGAITYGNAIGSPTPRFVPNVLLSGAGSPLVTALTDGLGTYSLSGFGSGSYTITPSKSGGVNGAVSSFDAARLDQHVIGIDLLTGNQLIVADVSGNGTISSYDAGLIAGYVVGLPAPGTAGNWIFNPVSNSHPTVTANISGENYSALLMGDVTGNWNDPTSLPGGRPANSNGPERPTAINAPHLVTPAHTEVLIPVGIQGTTNKGIISYEFALRYDPSVIRPQANPVDLTGTLSRGLYAVANSGTPGLLRVAVYGPIPIDGNGILLNLRFTAVGAPGSVSPLTWERIMLNEGYPTTTATDGQVEIRLSTREHN